MIPDHLHPSLDLLSEEYVLVQAWKKTTAYLRNRSWVADTLALDRAEVNLPKFLASIRERLHSPNGWRNSPLRLILAPKSQQWEVTEDQGWQPREDATMEKLRPLAHVDLADQVVATAAMLCLRKFARHFHVLGISILKSGFLPIRITDSGLNPCHSVRFRAVLAKGLT